MFVREELKLILSVYVDDFNLVGKAENLERLDTHGEQLVNLGSACSSV